MYCSSSFKFKVPRNRKGNDICVSLKAGRFQTQEELMFRLESEGREYSSSRRSYSMFYLGLQLIGCGPLRSGKVTYLTQSNDLNVNLTQNHLY
jgi:hypothetical protein